MKRFASGVLVLGVAGPAHAESYPIVVNECATGSAGWVELLNRGAQTLELAKDSSRWLLDAASQKPSACRADREAASGGALFGAGNRWDLPPAFEIVGAAGIAFAAWLNSTRCRQGVRKSHAE